MNQDRSHITEAQKLIVAQGRAVGKTTRKVAEEIGKSHVCVIKALKLPDVRDKIDAIRAKIIEKAGDTAAENFIHAIKSYRAPRRIKVKNSDGIEVEIDNPEVDKQLRDHGFRGSERLLEAIGSLPASNTSIHIQQIYNDNRTEVPEEIAAVLRELNSRDCPGSLVVDAEIEDGDAT